MKQRNLIEILEDQDKEIRRLKAALARSGYRKGETLEFTADDTFEKADYPGLRAIQIRAQGQGGRGALANAAGASAISTGSGASGGSYAETFVLADDLAASETIQVGAAVLGSGQAGESSFFGSHCVADGGLGGSTTLATGTSPTVFGRNVANAGSSVGDIVVPGEGGHSFVRLSGVAGMSGRGGSSFLGTGGSEQGQADTGLGNPGLGYGGGGSGGHSRNGSGAASGGQGALGVVLVELLY